MGGCLVAPRGRYCITAVDQKGLRALKTILAAVIGALALAITGVAAAGPQIGFAEDGTKYANDGGAPFNLDVRRNMGLNARYQFVLLYTVGWDRIAAAAAAINQAIEDGAFGVGEQAGLPLHRHRLEDAAAAHAAVESGAVGKVLITVGTS